MRTACGTILAVAALAIGGASAAEGWRVAEHNGAPGLFFDGRPVAPMLFWQWEIQEEDAKAFADAGVNVPDYFECMNEATVEMLDFYGSIVKDECGLPVLAFYGYTQDELWSIECDHRATSKMYRLGSVDMFSAPHTYHRRSPGEDGGMRCYLASAALLDCQYLTEGQKRLIDKLKSGGRTLVFFHAPGYVSETGLSRERMEGICGFRMHPGTVRGVLSAVDAETGREWGCGLDKVIDGVGDRKRGVRHRKPGTAQQGLFLPDEGDVLMTGVGGLESIPVAVSMSGYKG